MRKHLMYFWKNYQWPVLCFLAFLAFGLGFIGFKKYLSAIGQVHSFWDVFYLSIQLFILESGSVLGDVSWELEIARFLAPVVAAYTAVKALAVIFREQFQLVNLKFIKGHVIICGLGQKGLVFARNFCKQGHRVVVIELDKDNNMVDLCRAQGAIVLIGNAADKDLLVEAQVSKAKYIISVCGEDSINAEVAVIARELCGERTKNVLTCLVHIVDPQLCNLLRAKELETQKMDFFRLEFFNIYEIGARSLFENYPVFSEKDEFHEISPHMLIVGLGRMGKSLLAHAAREWKTVHKLTGKRLPITFIDRYAEAKRDMLCLQYPQLEKVCDIKALQYEIESTEFHKAEFLFDEEKKLSITNIYVCFDDASLSLSSALTLHQHLRDQHIPIVLMPHDAGFANLIQDKQKGGNVFSNLYAFGLLDITCRADLMRGGIYEILARDSHEDYVSSEKMKGNTIENNSSMVPWDELPENLKESNRRLADHIVIKLKAVDCCIAPLTDWDAELFKFTEEAIEKLAKMEHDRWNKERMLDGWRYGQTKDNEKKISPYLVPWDALSNDIREKDRNKVRELPASLAKAGFRIISLKKRA